MLTVAGLDVKRRGAVRSWSTQVEFTRRRGLSYRRACLLRCVAGSWLGYEFRNDFVVDAFATGEQLKCLMVADLWAREALAINVAGSIRSGRAIEVLAKLMTVHGAR